jgi:hypothetical protein
MLEATSMIRRSIPLLVLALVCLAGSSFAASKTYDSSPTNGTPGDQILSTTNLCPPVQLTPDSSFGHALIDDDDAGTVSLDVTILDISLIDLGADQLTVTFGPGAFIFIDNRSSNTNVPPGGSVHTAVFGSGTDPGESAIWGIVSGWAISGSRFCVSSPVSICNQNGFAHGATVPPVAESGTYNLNTWAFDAVGDYESAAPYIFRTSNGGLSNNQYRLRGAFHGSSLPALPLIGFGALALSLAVIGARSLMGKK